MNPKWRLPLITLIAGFALGAAFGRLCLGSLDRPPWKFEGDFKQALDHFSSKLSLNAEQRQKVSSVLERQKPKIEALRAECRPRMEAVRNETSSEIRKVLSPEQQAKFDIMQQKWQARSDMSPKEKK